MKRAWWLNLTLGAAVAGLALFVFLKPRPDTAGHALTTLKAGAARSILIERPGASSIVLARNADGWHMTAPLVAPADPARMQRLLAIAEARSAHRLAATDLARFELDRPQARLTIDGVSIAFGMLNPLTHEQYVLTGNAVYTVGFGYGTALPARPEDLIARQAPPAPAAARPPERK
jgi:hypothetical protein